MFHVGDYVTLTIYGLYGFGANDVIFRVIRESRGILDIMPVKCIGYEYGFAAFCIGEKTIFKVLDTQVKPFGDDLI